jgi:hypothetical protein
VVVIRKRVLKSNETVRTITGGITVFCQATPANCDVCGQEGSVLIQIQDEHGEIFDEAISLFLCKNHLEQFRRDLMFALVIPNTDHGPRNTEHGK